MKGFTLLLAILMKHSEGAMDITITGKPATVGDAVTITCTKSPTLEASVTWLNDRSTTNILSLCFHTRDLCTPSIKEGRYLFSSDVANRKFTMTILGVKKADAGVYTCKDSIEEGKATLQVQTASEMGKTEDGRLTGPAIVVVIVVEAVLVVGVGLSIGFLCYTGYFPGRWSATVPIPQTNYPHTNFIDVLSFAIQKEIMEETEASIVVRGEGSEMYGMQDDSVTNMPVADQLEECDKIYLDKPLEIFVTAVFKIRVQRAVRMLTEIIQKAIKQ